MRFKGTCSPDLLVKVQPYPVVLGDTLTNRQGIEPYVNIYCDSIRAVLTRELSILGRKEQDMTFGRAVGRIVSHELYHILSRTREHASGGLAEASCSAPELLAPRFHFGNHEVQLLRTRLLPVLLNHRLSTTDSPPPRGYAAYVKAGCSGCHGLQGEGTAWGPKFENAQSIYTTGSLQSRLKSHNSAMYRSAHELNLIWPRLRNDDIEAVAQFVQGLSKTAVAQAR